MLNFLFVIENVDMGAYSAMVSVSYCCYANYVN